MMFDHHEFRVHVPKTWNMNDTNVCLHNVLVLKNKRCALLRLVSLQQHSSFTCYSNLCFSKQASCLEPGYCYVRLNTVLLGTNTLESDKWKLHCPLGCTECTVVSSLRLPKVSPFGGCCGRTLKFIQLSNTLLLFAHYVGKRLNSN